VYAAVIAVAAAITDPVSSGPCEDPGEFDPEFPESAEWSIECSRCIALAVLRAAMPFLRPDLEVPQFLPRESVADVQRALESKGHITCATGNSG
jgi:hypothetical protein